MSETEDEMSEPTTAPLPPHTRLILASEHLLEQFGTRTESGDLITAEWGDEQPGGWWEPVVTVQYDDNLVAAYRADLAARVRALEVRKFVKGESDWQQGFRQSRNETVAAVLALLEGEPR